MGDGFEPGQTGRVRAARPGRQRGLPRRDLLAGAAGVVVGAGGALAAGWLLGRNDDLPLGGTAVLGVAVDLHAQITASGAPLFPEGTTTPRVVVAAWDPSVPGAREAFGQLNENLGPVHAVIDDTRGLMTLSTRDPHCGCRVPWCASSEMFENPCHGERYNRWGENLRGPSTRGLDGYASSVDDRGAYVVDFRSQVPGRPAGDTVLQQRPAGPHCIDL